jgi:di/tricarboxylate transporter
VGLSIHAIGVIGLVLVFVIGTLRPVNLGALALVATFLVGTVFVREPVRDLYTGFPVDLLLLLVGVTYLFGVGSSNGTIERIVESSARLARGRRALIPWVVFVVASLPAMAGALGSAGVALLAPISLSLAKRCDIDRRMIGLMVVHGAAAGNFSPLNVLGAIVHQAMESNGLEMSRMALFAGNLAYNVALAAIIFIVFGGLRLSVQPAPAAERSLLNADRSPDRSRADQICTVLAVAAVAFLAFVLGLNIGFLALAAAVLLTLLFPTSSAGAEKKIAWGVVLLVCGIVTYVTALQRYGTVDAIGGAIGRWSTPLVTALLICAVGAVTSAFASSAGILGAMVPLAVPFMAQGEVATTGFVVALAISATVVDSTPFSTVGALVVANAGEDERTHVYRGLLAWGGAMVLTAPLLTWLIFVLPGN